MKFSYSLSKICGSVFENGNLAFTADGNCVISPVGNRVNIFDLVKHTCTCLPFENKKNIKRIAVSHNNRFLVTVDVDGHALFINLERKVILNRINFKRKVKDIKFSPDDKYVAVTSGHGCQVWRTPSIQRDFCPMTLSRTLAGLSDDATCIDWSADSCSLIIGAKDMTCRVYYRVSSRHMSSSTLSGHRDVLVGAFYAADGDSAYTIARDGGIFTWKYEYADRIPIAVNHSNSDSDGSSSEEGEEEALVWTKRGGHWSLSEREFLWDGNTSVSSCAFNRSSSLLVVGFSNGVFGLYEMPGTVHLQKLSVSSHSINAACINTTGEWLALGSSRFGQLLVWEWQSESYVMRQQGHLYGLNAMDFASDGQYIATGGEDAKVKLWNAATGFCFITFSEHVAPVTGVKFVGRGAGKAVISSSLDGTVRAFDLLRYKNFRTMTTPSPVQFTSLAVDSSGEMVCAGALDPFHIYVWSLQTGALLDMLAGHEGPIACLDFAANSAMLASGSWDGTMKLWNIYQNECVETFEHGCDVLAVAFRPDGKEVCAATTNGNLTFWDVEAGTQVSSIEGRRDIAGGRKSMDAMTADTSARSKYFNALAYTADGTCVLAGGKSKFVCIYATASGTLVKKFQLSHNRSLEAMSDELRSDQFVDGVAVANLRTGDSDDEHLPVSVLPGANQNRGAGGTATGSRTTRPEVLTAAVGFSPTGREWAAATTEGLQVFSLDSAMLFAPTDIDIAITPQAVQTALRRCEYALAINMALHLGERDVLKQAVDEVPLDSISLVIKTLDGTMLRDMMRFVAEEVVG